MDHLERAALKQARELYLAIHLGQDIEYVVDEKSSRERAALTDKDIDAYDSNYYKIQLVHAIESIFRHSGGIERISPRIW